MDQETAEAPLKRTFRGYRDAVPYSPIDEPDLGRRILTTLNAFRLLIAAGLLVLFAAGADPRLFGDARPTLFAASAAGYLVFAILSAISLRERLVPEQPLGVVQLIVDIGAITLMMHASGGISSGLGGLLVVFIGAGSLALPLQYSAVLATVATFTILGEQLHTQLSNVGSAPNWPAAGILSGIVLATAFAVQPLARRIAASEELARRFGVDLKNLSELNQYIVQHLRESIVVIDADDSLRLINSSATRLLGVQGVVAGTPLAMLCEPLAHHIAAWRDDHSLSSHPEFTLPVEGNSLRLTAHLAPLGRDGQRAGPILIFLEDQSLMNARVQQSKLASLGRLSASIAHEIRNPVGAMSHAAQLLEESPALGEDDRRLTEIIRTHSGRVSHIIDNVLQLSRRESSRPERLAVGEWLAEFADEFVRTHELQEGEFTIAEVADGLEVRMDRSHLRQVLWNLCDNAVKYASETGGILVELAAGRIQGHGRPYLEVRDSGNGVDAATAEKIFEPFFYGPLRWHGPRSLYLARALRVESRDPRLP